ncbi:helix-turn-helix domain-containing protein [Actinomyces bowdenii]|uniref:helix-turn-helix domain-containing protein n=1 Tax=Actinomyces bowdenii TaxID=131109 RepID=UPI0035A3D236
MKSGTIELVNSHVYEDGASGRPQGKLMSAAARTIGVAAQVLRHLEDEGVLIPGREAQGHRRYTRVDITRGQQIRYAQALGLSLAQIRAFLHGLPADRAMLYALTMTSFSTGYTRFSPRPPPSLMYSHQDPYAIALLTCLDRRLRRRGRSSARITRGKREGLSVRQEVPRETESSPLIRGTCRGCCFT